MKSFTTGRHYDTAQVIRYEEKESHDGMTKFFFTDDSRHLSGYVLIPSNRLHLSSYVETSILSQYDNGTYDQA